MAKRQHIDWANDEEREHFHVSRIEPMGTRNRRHKPSGTGYSHGKEKTREIAMRMEREEHSLRYTLVTTYQSQDWKMLEKNAHEAIRFAEKNGHDAMHKFAYNNLSVALHHQQRYDELEEVLRKKIALAKKTDDKEYQHINSILLTSAYMDCEKYEELELLCKEMLVLAKELDSPHQLYINYIMLVKSLINQGKWEELERQADEALADGGQYTHRKIMQHAYYMKKTALRELGRSDDLKQMAQEHYEYSCHTDDKADEFFALLSLYWIADHEGDRLKTLDILKQQLHLLREYPEQMKMGDVDIISNNCKLILRAMRALDEMAAQDVSAFQEMEDMAKEAVIYGRSQDNKEIQSIAYYWLATSLREQGKWEKLEETARESIKAAQHYGDVVDEFYGLIRLAKSLQQQELWDDMVEVLQQQQVLAIAHPEEFNLSKVKWMLRYANAMRGKGQSYQDILNRHESDEVVGDEHVFEEFDFGKPFVTGQEHPDDDWQNEGWHYLHNDTDISVWNPAYDRSSRQL